MFKAKACNVAVEIHSGLTIGHTAVDFWNVSGRPVNARWVYGVDAEAFYDLLIERLARYGS
jgi:purine nucleosidase